MTTLVNATVDYIEVVAPDLKSFVATALGYAPNATGIIPSSAVSGAGFAPLPPLPGGYPYVLYTNLGPLPALVSPDPGTVPDGNGNLSSGVTLAIGASVLWLDLASSSGVRNVYGVGGATTVNCAIGFVASTT